MNLVPGLNTAGQQVGTYAFPSPADYLHLDSRVLGPIADAVKVEQAIWIEELEAGFEEVRKDQLLVVLESFENKLETDEPSWWTDIEDIRERKARVAHMVNMLVPRWKLSGSHKGAVLCVPSEEVHRVLHCKFWSSRPSLYGRMNRWDLYWEVRT